MTSTLLKHTGITDHTIKLIKNQQLFYRSIYSLGLIKLEILKAYIKTNLSNMFIKSYELPTDAYIFFDQKLDKSICLYVWSCNNLTIKNGTVAFDQNLIFLVEMSILIRESLFPRLLCHSS